MNFPSLPNFFSVTYCAMAILSSLDLSAPTFDMAPFSRVLSTCSGVRSFKTSREGALESAPSWHWAQNVLKSFGPSCAFAQPRAIKKIKASASCLSMIETWVNEVKRIESGYVKFKVNCSFTCHLVFVVGQSADVSPDVLHVRCADHTFPWRHLIFSILD